MKIDIPDDTVQAIRATGAEVSAFVRTAVSKVLSEGRPAVVATASRLARQLSPADRNRLRDDFNALRGVLVGSSIDEVCGDRHEGLR